MLGYIYKFENSLNGKVYIGQTIDEEYRRNRHMRDSKSVKTKFYNSVRKHGIDNFKYSVIFIVLDVDGTDDLNAYEQYFIASYDSFKNGYNSNIGGNSSFGFKHSPQTIAKMKIEKLKNNPQRGKPLTKEHKDKIAEKMTGENNHFYGKTQPDHIKAIISSTHKGKTLSDEHRNILSTLYSGEGNPMYGKKRPEVGELAKKLLGKRVEVLGVTYASMREAEKISGISRGTIHRWIKKDNGKAKLLDTTQETSDNTQNNQGL